MLLSITSIMLGGVLAFSEPSFNIFAVTFAALTAFLLQLISNFANDYGDFKKGLDNEDRIGPKRALQSGEITEKQMLIGIIITVILAIVSGALLFFVFARLTWRELAVFAGLGGFSVVAALLYTLGKHPYGYYGLGDLFIFVFFGLVAVCGTYYLASKSFDYKTILPASAMGFLSVAGMNINNMRDYVNDKAHGKNTMAVKLGLKGAFVYHAFMLVLPFVCLSVYLLLLQTPWYTHAFWLLFPLFLKDLITVRKTMETALPLYLLPKQVLQSFILILVFGVLLVIA